MGNRYDEKNKDGFITRDAEPKDFGAIKDFKFKNEFYVQRALSGRQKVLVKKMILFFQQKLSKILKHWITLVLRRPSSQAF